MSTQDIKKLSKADLKNKLIQMGMSLDRNDHPREYYAQLYLEKTNTRNKITRGNTPFYKEKMLTTKRERNNEKGVNNELKDDPNYEEEEYEEEGELKDDENEENIYEEEEEESKDNNKKGKANPKRKKKAKNKNEDKKDGDYKESVIKVTRLICKKPEKKIKGGKVILENPNRNDVPKRNIINNFEEMAGQKAQNYNNNADNKNNGETAVRQSINNIVNNDMKNNDFPQYNSNNINNVPNNDGAISIRVEKINNCNNNQGSNVQVHNSEEPVTPNKNIGNENNEKMTVSFGAPKNQQFSDIHLDSSRPVLFGFNQNSTTPKLNENNNNIDNNKEGNNSNPQKYNFLLRSAQNEDKKNDKFVPKKVILKWDSPNQKEFVSFESGKEKEEHGPSVNQENIKLNDEEHSIEYQNNYSPKEEPKEQLYSRPPNKQPFSESIQNDNINQYGNKNNNNYNTQNDYKSKLRSYQKNNKNTNDNDNNIELLNLKNADKNPRKIKNTNINMNNNDNLDNTQNMNNYDNYNINNNDVDNNYNIQMGENKDNINNINNYANNNQINPMNQNNVNENDNEMEEGLIEYEDDNDNANQYDNYNNNNINTENEMYNNNNNNINPNNSNNTFKQENTNNDNNDNNNNLQEDKSSEATTTTYSTFSTFSLGQFGTNLKNGIVSKFQKYAYLLPLILLIVFGIVYLVNEHYEYYDRANIIIPFSIIMGILIIYNLYKYIKDINKYKKMAREDRQQLIDKLQGSNIRQEEMDNTCFILINNFIKSRILYHNITYDEYVNYVFPYLIKFMKKDGYLLKKVPVDKKDNISYWGEI